MPLPKAFWRYSTGMPDDRFCRPLLLLLASAIQRTCTPRAFASFAAPTNRLLVVLYTAMSRVLTALLM